MGNGLSAEIAYAGVIQIALNEKVAITQAHVRESSIGSAVLEFRPAETLSPVGAISPAYPCLCRPRHLPSPAHPREKPGFSTAVR